MRSLLIVTYAWFLERYRKTLMLTNTTMKLLYLPWISPIRTYHGKIRASAEFIKAKYRVPAYHKFLNASGSKASSALSQFTNIPFTDKENYVKSYSMDERCNYGKIPDTNVVLDESSGSSGTATNWARGGEERKKNARVIQFSLQHLLGKEPMFIINAFALGPWATGVNITMSCVKFSKLKSLGPDKIKIENTIKHFGTGHHFVVMGYPPFLKMLAEEADVNWHNYNVTFIFGGESMTEGMRDHLMKKGIKRLYSSLGASDLELNLAGETDFTISVRKLLRSNEALRNRMLKYGGALPMVFQYNPADFLIESTNEGELIITVCRPGYISPKIRYNIHDKGHVMELKEFFSILKELNIDKSSIEKPKVDLPLLLHYGRADMSVSFFGSNISPTDLQETVYGISELADIVNSFCLDTHEDKEGNKKLIVSLELHKGKKVNEKEAATLNENFFDKLTQVNQDFREARKMIKKNQTTLKFYEHAQGPFANNDIRIKAKYIAS